MELYAVGIEYEGAYAIFSTMELAEAHVAKNNKYGDLYIETFTVDAEV
jgi:hypothetical protein